MKPEDKPVKAGWRKALYGGKQVGFKDNYTDESFLQEMVVNANVRKRDWGTVMRDSVAISQHFSLAAVVAVVWAHALHGSIGASSLLLIDAIIFGFDFLALLVTTDKVRHLPSALGNMRNLGLFVSWLYVLSPVFQTLTRSISSDSIWAMTTCLVLLHLYFHDYSVGDGSRNTISSNVSLNASIASSVLIASRVSSQQLVFALMLFSLQSFLIFPVVACWIRQCSFELYLVFSVMCLAIATGLLFLLNQLAFSVFVLVVAFITFVCPFWLIRIQKYKFEINGPWDEAKLCFDLD